MKHNCVRFSNSLTRHHSFDHDGLLRWDHDLAKNLNLRHESENTYQLPSVEQEQVVKKSTSVDTSGSQEYEIGQV